MFKTRNRILFVKPPDCFLENEFVYQQLGLQYIQSFLHQHDILSDIPVFFEPPEVRMEREEFIGILEGHNVNIWAGFCHKSSNKFKEKFTITG